MSHGKQGGGQRSRVGRRRRQGPVVGMRWVGECRAREPQEEARASICPWPGLVGWSPRPARGRRVRPAHGSLQAKPRRWATLPIPTPPHGGRGRASGHRYAPSHFCSPIRLSSKIIWSIMANENPALCGTSINAAEQYRTRSNFNSKLLE